MAITKQESGFLSSAAAAAEQKVRRQIKGLMGSCEGCVHPDGTLVGPKLGDVPDEPRQWCAFEYADLMEQGLSNGHASSFIEAPPEEMRLCVELSDDEKEILLCTPNGDDLLLARRNDNNGFNVFIASEEGKNQQSSAPAFTLTSEGSKDRWILHAATCDQCEGHGRRNCGRRELATIRHHVEEVGDAKICCMDVEIPAETKDGSLDVWCPMCKGQKQDQECIELSTRRPTWSRTRKALLLDFFGRCSLASVRNFQLELPEAQGNVKLLFGKVGPNQHILDFSKPLGPIQAFAMAISAFDWK